MDWSYLIQAGKEGFRERVFVYQSTEAATAGVAINATPTAFAAAEAMLTIDNTANSVNSGEQQVIIPISIDLYCTAAGDGTHWAVQLVKDNATQWSSGGTTPPAVQTSYDTRTSYSDRTPKGQIHFGDLTLVTGSSRGNLGWYPFMNQADGFTVGDHYQFRFGALGVSRTGRASVAAIVDSVIDLPPVWIGRQSSLIVQPFGTAATSAPSFSINVCTLELGHPRTAA